MKQLPILLLACAIAYFTITLNAPADDTGSEPVKWCFNCNGTGKIECTACDDHRLIPCPICDGTGVVPQSWTAFDNPKMKTRPSYFTLKDGRVIFGRKLMVLGDEVTFSTEKGNVKVKASDIISEKKLPPWT